MSTPSILLFTSYAPELGESPKTAAHFQQWRRMNPRFEVRYFSDADVDDFFADLPWHGAYKKLRTGVARADFFRASWIYVHGGYWFDFDMEPTCLHECLEKADGMSPLTFFDMGYKNLSYMLWGGRPNSPLVKRLCDEVASRIHRYWESAAGSDILEITGPRVIQSIVSKLWNVEIADGAFAPPPGGRWFRRGEYQFWYAKGPELSIKSQAYREIQTDRSVQAYIDSPFI